mgnify:FL=1|jgi:hypothetical protein
MNSMENFFNWMSKPVSKEDVVVWFNIHNMNYEKIELYGDIFRSLNFIIIDTYLGDEKSETKITMSKEDNTSHFNWCWNKLLEDFRKENINIKHGGKHKDYFESFFDDSFYNQKEENIKNVISHFITEVFNIEKPFSKSDLDILTELYKLLEKNIET